MTHARLLPEPRLILLLPFCCPSSPVQYMHPPSMVHAGDRMHMPTYIMSEPYECRKIKNPVLPPSPLLTTVERLLGLASRRSGGSGGSTRFGRNTRHRTLLTELLAEVKFSACPRDGLGLGLNAQQLLKQTGVPEFGKQLKYKLLQRDLVTLAMLRMPLSH